MQRENRLRKRSLSQPDATYRDELNARDDSPLGKVALAVAAFAGMRMAYNRGLLKPLVRKGAEVLETVASGTTDRAYKMSGIIKDWTIYGIDGYRPEHSLLRNNVAANFRRAFGDIVETRRLNTAGIKSMIDDTAEDIAMLQKQIKERMDVVDEIRQKYTETDLSESLRQLRVFSREVQNNFSSEAQQQAARSIAMREFLNDPKYVLSAEDAAEQVRRNGLRKLTIGDVINRPYYDDTGELIFDHHAGMDEIFTPKAFGRMKDLEMIMTDPRYRYAKNGIETNLINDWETMRRMIIDDRLYIDEAGKVVDLRMPYKTARAFGNSLATDFKIPGLGFNPLATMTNLGRTEKKSMFGILDSGSLQPFITKRAGVYQLKNTTGDGNLIFAGDSVFKPDNMGGFSFYDDGFEFMDITSANTFGFNKTLQSVQHMADLRDLNYVKKNRGTYDDYAEKVYKNLHLSREVRSNVRFSPDGVPVTMSEPDRTLFDYMQNPFFLIEDKVSAPLAKKINPYDMSIEIPPSNIFNVHLKDMANEVTGETFKARQFVAVKKGMKLADVKEMDGITGKRDYMKSYLMQFIGGRMDNGTMRDFTKTTTSVYGLFDSVLDRIGGIAPMLRFEDADKGNLLQYLTNFAVYRAVPIYAATRVPGVINALSEPVFGVLGFNRKSKQEDKYNDNHMNLGKFIMGDIVRPVDMAFHGIKDVTFMTDIFKKLGELFPGADQINELPGIYQLGLGQTQEERREYIENGYDPVRKSRWWTMSNTPFTGGKISYFRPNFYRRVAADADFSDSKWGSRWEYYSNTWYPNPVNPLAPLNKLSDPNHYDYKHYYDRPYLMTAPQGGQILLIGPLIAGTVGQYSKHKMHEEYWDGNVPVEKNDEAVPLLTQVQRDTAWLGVTDVTPGPTPSVVTHFEEMDKHGILPGSHKNVTTIREINKHLDAEQLAQETIALQDLQMARTSMYNGRLDKSILSEKIPVIKMGKSTGGSVQANVLPRVTDNTFSTYNASFQFQYSDNPEGHYELYTTPSGSMSVIDVPADLDLWTANTAVSNYSVKKLFGTNERAVVNDPNRFSPQLADYSNTKFNNSFIYNAGEEFNTLTDFFGMKGYELRTFVTGNANENAKKIDDSSYAYSFNKSFWDENLGGLGGFGESGDEASEIFRRFVQKRNRNVDYIDPVRNTMPSWAPGRDYFLDMKHGDPYSKIENGEERLPGEGYERMYGINQETMFGLGIGSSYIGKSESEMIKHMLGDKEVDIENLSLPDGKGGYAPSAAETGNKIHDQIEHAWAESGLAIATEGEFTDDIHNIKGYFDAMVKDPTSPTGIGIVDIKSVNDEKFQSVMATGQPLYEHQSQVNYYLWATGNTKSNGYVYYVNRDDPNQTMTTAFNYNPELLRENLTTLASARNKIYEGLQNGTIGRGELYSNIDRLRILADVAPYSQEYEDAKAAVAFDDSLTAEDKEEVSRINERVKAQKEPLRVYPYKFSTADNTVSETVRVKEIVDNNHILVSQYGTDHAITFAGLHVSESNSEMYDDDTTMNEAAYKELKRHFKKGRKITITYDARERMKFNKDSTESIKASINSGGRNVNKILLNKGLATEKEYDQPSGIRARYSDTEIAIGSMFEYLTHTFAQIPFVGNKWLHVKSPYEEYRDMEVYGKSYQSWDNPLKDFLIPEMDKQASAGPIGGLLRGAFIGSLWGHTNSLYGKLVGTVVGGAAGLAGGTYAMANSTKDRKWRPKRRRQQEEINEYLDMLNYIKNTGLYEKYKQKAWREDHYDLDDIVNAKAIEGVENKNRSAELTDFKKTVKLDFKHANEYSFKYGLPKYVDFDNMGKKEMISAINQELAEIQSDRSIDAVPENAVRAIYYKQQADQTMYGYEPGDPLQNIMKALPKKERQYFKHMQDAPLREQKKILEIAPSYLRRALQQSWGMKVEGKPNMVEYFEKHGLPGADWIGWDEDVDMEDVKVKLVHQEKQDYGEYDIWDDQIDSAQEAQIPIPAIHARSTGSEVQAKLRRILTQQGYEDVVLMRQYENSPYRKNKINIYQSKEDAIEQAIANMDMQ